MKKKFLFVSMALIVGVILGFVFPFRITQLNIIAENVEALTKNYETKKIDGVNCTATELGRKPDKGEVEQLPPNQIIPTVVFSTIDNEDQIFYALASNTPETLKKCDLDNYGHGFGNNSYCWLSSSQKDKKNLRNRFVLKITNKY